MKPRWNDGLQPADPNAAGAAHPPGVRLEGVTKIYPNGIKAVDDISLEIADGEFMVLVGPSGCGKSTLLRMIAGLEQVSAGSVVIGDRDVTELAPRERDIAMVFQNYALYPHMTVQENLGFGLKLRKVSKRDRAERVVHVATKLGLEDFLDRKPAELSGGQRQRVAMGRAMVREPKAFLMDEPLSNLDAKLRVSMRGELARLHERLGVTTIYVTHDQVEAMTLGQRVAVLRDGVLQQVDTPQALFRRPANLFVAAFIGSPSMNLIEADVAGGTVRFAGHELQLPADAGVGNRRVILGIRPTDFEHAASAEPSLPRLTARVEVVEDLGAETHVIFPLDAPRVVAEAVRAAVETAAEEEGALFADDQRALFTACVDADHVVRPGSSIELAVDTRRMHFFEPATGEVLGTGLGGGAQSETPGAAR
jgi:multiple sugar transport system ATP-binding protein